MSDPKYAGEKRVSDPKYAGRGRVIRNMLGRVIRNI